MVCGLNDFVEKLMGHVLVINALTAASTPDEMQDVSCTAEGLKDNAETFLDAAKAAKTRFVSFLNSLSK